MNSLSRLLLAGSLALLAPALALASGGSVIVVNPTGLMRVQVEGGGVDIDGFLSVMRGRIEIQKGRELLYGLQQEFCVTRLSLGMHNIILRDTSEGDLRWQQVALHLLGSVCGMGFLEQTDGPYPRPEIWHMQIYNDRASIIESGDPMFRASAMVAAHGTTDYRAYSLEDRISETLTAKIDYATKTFTMRIVLRGPKVEAPWYAPWVDDVTSKFTVTMSGDFTEQPSAGSPALRPESSPVELRSKPATPEENLEPRP